MKTHRSQGSLGHIDVALLSSPVGSSRDEREIREHISKLRTYVTFGKGSKRGTRGDKGTEGIDVVVSTTGGVTADEAVKVPVTDVLHGHRER